MTADPIAAAYSAAASAANGGTLAARPGSVGNVAGESVGPMTDGEFVARFDALRDMLDALHVGVATLRDSDAAERLGVDLRVITRNVYGAQLDLHDIRRHQLGDEHA